MSGSHDKTIKVWNVKTNSPWSVMTLAGHSGEVRCLHLEGNRLVSGSTDLTIKVWDLSTTSSWSSIACRVTMVGHTDTVRCVQMDQAKDLVISGSYDTTLKLWELKTGNCVRSLRGHQGPVLAIQVGGFHKRFNEYISKTTNPTSFRPEAICWCLVAAIVQFGCGN